MHTLLLDKDGHIWAAGAKAYAGFHSEDGYKTLEEQDMFRTPPDLLNKKFIQISSGDFHNLALRYEKNKDNEMLDKLEVYGWGKSENGKLAQENFMSFEDKDVRLKNILLPKKIESMEKIENMQNVQITEDLENMENMIQISCGANHSVSLHANGQPYVWGSLLNGRLGIDKDQLKTKKKIQNDHNILSLSTPCPVKLALEQGIFFLASCINNFRIRNATQYLHS